MPLSNAPRILRGAFVEYGRSVPPLVVVFQFNPEQLSRSRSLSFSVPGSAQRAAREAGEGWLSLREFHQRSQYDDLNKLRDDQQVRVQEESISFDVRLDATDRLNEGDPVAEQYGIAPRLATLERMMQPRGEGLLGEAADELLGLGEEGFSFTGTPNPPMILFIWGRRRVLPVNIQRMNVTESAFNTELNPIRATVSVSLTVIEGGNAVHTYSKAMAEAESALNLSNAGDVANVVIPG